MTTMLSIKCDCCNDNFEIATKNYKYRSKNINTKFYCSYKCRVKASRTGTTLNCTGCNKEIYVQKSQIDSDNHFCSSSCAAHHNNKSRVVDKNKTKQTTCKHCGVDVLIKINASIKNASCEPCKIIHAKKIVNKKTKTIKHCETCKKEFNSYKSKYCSTTCEKFRIKKCTICGNDFQYSDSRAKYCSKKCHSVKQKEFRDSLPYEKKCMVCKRLFKTFQNNTCSNDCLNRSQRRGGARSAKLQGDSRRSKNEIYFAELCKAKFSVIENEPMFNGWYADVIIPELKLAVLWNGNWHHIKIATKHSVKQVQNRDKIKQKEIIKAGYTSYIIDDFGKHNPKFVESEFKKFIDWINSSK